MIEECINQDTIIYHRCRYVVEENIRVQEGCIDLLNGNLTAFGEKMFATHIGLSEQYGVSCKELDFLVEAVKNMPAVVGARMMGGGFGGCTINIVEINGVDTLIQSVTEKYHHESGKELKAYVVQIEDGTSLIS
jgi:galactokinase